MRGRLFSCFFLGALLIATALVACSPTRDSAPPKRVNPRRIEQLIQRYYGSTLATVVVGPRVEKAPHPPFDMYVSHYRLKDIPLDFPFRIGTTADKVDADLSGGAEGERSLTHEDIGGVVRFYQLAQQYHADFPSQQSMSYWRASDNEVDKREPYRSILSGHPGLSVVVYEFDDYWGDPSARQLGIYWWDPASQRWVLIHRGALPDMR